MDVSGTVRIRFLPEGTSQEARVIRQDGKLVELAIDSHASNPEVGALLEMSDAAAIYLGVVQQATSAGPAPQFTMQVEHYLDRKAASEMQAAWSQVGPAS